MSVLAKNSAKNTNDLFIKGAPEYLVNAANRILTKSGKIVDLTADNKKKIND